MPNALDFKLPSPNRADSPDTADVVPGFRVLIPNGAHAGTVGVVVLVGACGAQRHTSHHRPEGTACAEVQVAAQAGGTQARLLFGGMLVGAIYTAVEKFLRLWPAEPDLQLGSRQMGYRTSVGAPSVHLKSQSAFCAP